MARNHHPLWLAHRRLAAMHAPCFEAEQLRRQYSYAVPSAEAIAELVAHSPVVEMGAGHGYWANLASRAGARVIAYDDPYIVRAYTSGPRHFDVEAGGPECVAQHRDCTLFLCWPPRADRFALECLLAYTGPRLLYAGPEGSIRAHAGDEPFHLALDRGWRLLRRIALPPWPERELQCSFRVYERLS